MQYGVEKLQRSLNSGIIIKLKNNAIRNRTDHN